MTARAAATDAFIAWIESEAPKKTGPSGVGKENYTWYEQNVHLVPYDWDQQVTLLRRELERARASLALEEFRNRELPQLAPADTPEAWRALVEARMQKFTDFLIQSGIVPDRAYFRDALAQQVPKFVPPEKRNFFDQAIAREPLGLFSHDYHWIELARMKEEPNHSAIRRLPALSNMFDSRSEGLATAMEETLMQAGLYDDNPRGREIVWIMLANRAARGLASLYVQSNELSLQQAGRFHAQWTPRGWSDPASPPGGLRAAALPAPARLWHQLHHRQAAVRAAHQRLRAGQQQLAGKPFNLGEFFAHMNACRDDSLRAHRGRDAPPPAARGTPVPDALYDLGPGR